MSIVAHRILSKVFLLSLLSTATSQSTGQHNYFSLRSSSKKCNILCAFRVKALRYFLGRTGLHEVVEPQEEQQEPPTVELR